MNKAAKSQVSEMLKKINIFLNKDTFKNGGPGGGNPGPSIFRYILEIF